MARRKSGATTPEGRFIAARIRDAERRGYTQRQIAEAFGIPGGPRTVRKIKSGETSGTRTYHRKMDALERPRSTPNIFRADLVIGEENGREIVRTVNVKLPDLATTHGRAAPTPFDALRLPSLQEVAIAEGNAMRRRYGLAEFRVKLDGLRSVMRRGPTSKLVEIRGIAAR